MQTFDYFVFQPRYKSGYTKYFRILQTGSVHAGFNIFSFYGERALVNKLYRDVIEDSVLYDMSILVANFDKIVYTESVLQKRFFYIENYRKDLLEQWNGFKVIKIGEDKYKRVPLSE